MSEKQEKILLVITQGIVGGAPLSVLSLARELKKQGKDVTVAFGEGEFLADECRKEGIMIIRPRFLLRSLNPFTALRFIFESKRIVEQGGFTVVHLNSTHALFAAVGAKLADNKPRTIFTFRGLSFIDEHADVSFFVKWFYWAVFKVLLLFVDENVFVSEANAAAAKRMRLVHDGHVIHNGLDPERLHFLPREEARQELEKNIGENLDQIFLLGSTGRLVMQKNYEFLIEQAAWLKKVHPHVRTVIIGEGEERPKLEALIKKHGLDTHVFLAGEIAGASRYLKAFDVFVLTSRYEGFSMSLTEALFAGVPVLASDVGGASEQFSHAPMQVYPFGNVEIFQEHLARLITNLEARQDLAVSNPVRSNDFNIKKTAREYLRVY